MLLYNIHSAYRSLRSAPAYSLLAVASLAVAIGGTFSVFVLVNAIVLKPLSYPGSDRLVLITQRNTARKASGTIYSSLGLGIVPIEFLRWRAEVDSLESIGGARSTKTILTGTGATATALGEWQISSSFFDSLQVRPQLGRWFTASEEKREAPDVAILTDTLWRRNFGADPKIVGKKILLAGAPYEVVGVTAPDLKLPHGRHLELPGETDILSRGDLPLRMNKVVSAPMPQ